MKDHMKNTGDVKEKGTKTLDRKKGAMKKKANSEKEWLEQNEKMERNDKYMDV